MVTEKINIETTKNNNLKEMQEALKILQSNIDKLQDSLNKQEGHAYEFEGNVIKLQGEISALKKKISTQLATKNDLRRETKTLWKESLRLEEQIEDLKEAVNRRFDQLDEQRKKDKNEMMNKLDYIIGEIQTMREENTVAAYQFRELRNDVNDHEKRLTKLEHS